MKIRVQIPQSTEVDIKLPFYAKLEGEDYNTYAKITKDCFRKVLVPNYVGGIELFKSKGLTEEIAYNWYKNECTKQEWDEMLKWVKAFVKKF